MTISFFESKQSRIVSWRIVHSGGNLVVRITWRGEKDENEQKENLVNQQEEEEKEDNRPELLSEHIEDKKRKSSRKEEPERVQEVKYEEIETNEEMRHRGWYECADELRPSSYRLLLNESIDRQTYNDSYSIGKHTI